MFSVKSENCVSILRNFFAYIVLLFLVLFRLMFEGGFEEEKFSTPSTTAK